MILNRTCTELLSLAAVLVLLGSRPCDLLGQDPEPSSVVESAPAPVISYQVEPTWPSSTPMMEWAAVPGVAFDGDDCIWVFTRTYENPVRVYKTNGDFVCAWGTGKFDTPHHIRIDHRGDVWTADWNGHAVRKFSPAGDLLLTLGTPGVPGTDPDRFNGPTDMAITRSGNIFVSDGYVNSRIVHFNQRGEFVKEWGQLGNQPGELQVPHAIAVDSRGLLYVADRKNARVQVFDQRGCVCDQWKNLIVPWGIWITPQDEIWICGSAPMADPGQDARDQLFMRFDRSGRVQQLWTLPRDLSGTNQDWIHGIAVDDEGNIYLGEIQGRRVQKYIRHQTGP